MSGAIRYSYADAMIVANALTAALAPDVERVVVAGSLRRRRPDVGDVEILYIPRHEERQIDLVTRGPVNVTEEAIESMLARGVIFKRPNVKGGFNWGEKNKLALFRGGVPVDFFATTPENWWVSLVIRTGGLDTNKMLTLAANKIGRSLNAYGCGVTCSDCTVIPATSERHVFELCGCEYIEPEDRK